MLVALYRGEECKDDPSIEWHIIDDMTKNIDEITKCKRIYKLLQWIVDALVEGGDNPDRVLVARREQPQRT